jgi:hypothetical protein
MLGFLAPAPGLVLLQGQGVLGLAQLIEGLKGSFFRGVSHVTKSMGRV